MAYFEPETIGEIQRPLIFKLKSRFQLKEIVAQRMHVGACVYPILDVDMLLGVGKSFQDTGIDVSTIGRKAAVNCVVPVGKRWMLYSVAVGQLSGAGVAGFGFASLRRSGAAFDVALTDSFPAGAAFVDGDFKTAQYAGMLLESGDSVDLKVIVAQAASTAEVNISVIEQDFRENVV